jgi:hypothetical protein
MHLLPSFTPNLSCLFSYCLQSQSAVQIPQRIAMHFIVGNVNNGTDITVRRCMHLFSQRKSAKLNRSIFYSVTIGFVKREK